MIHETHTDTGKWLELDPGAQRTIAIRTWFFDCRLIVNNNNNNTLIYMYSYMITYKNRNIIPVCREGNKSITDC